MSAIIGASWWHSAGTAAATAGPGRPWARGEHGVQAAVYGATSGCARRTGSGRRGTLRPGPCSRQRGRTPGACSGWTSSGGGASRSAIGAVSLPGSLSLSLHKCSNCSMGVRRPSWWFYPLECLNGHIWAPGTITVGWSPCDCPPAVAAHGEVSGAGHLVVWCNQPGCNSRWYRPRCEWRR